MGADEDLEYKWLLAQTNSRAAQNADSSDWFGDWNTDESNFAQLRGGGHGGGKRNKCYRYLFCCFCVFFFVTASALGVFFTVIYKGVPDVSVVSLTPACVSMDECLKPGATIPFKVVYGVDNANKIPVNVHANVQIFTKDGKKLLASGTMKSSVKVDADSKVHSVLYFKQSAEKDSLLSHFLNPSKGQGMYELLLKASVSINSFVSPNRNVEHLITVITPKKNDVKTLVKALTAVKPVSHTAHAVVHKGPVARKAKKATKKVAKVVAKKEDKGKANKKDALSAMDRALKKASEEAETKKAASKVAAAPKKAAAAPQKAAAAPKKVVAAPKKVADKRTAKATAKHAARAEKHVEKAEKLANVASKAVKKHGAKAQKIVKQMHKSAKKHIKKATKHAKKASKAIVKEAHSAEVHAAAKAAIKKTKAAAAKVSSGFQKALDKARAAVHAALQKQLAHKSVQKALSHAARKDMKHELSHGISNTAHVSKKTAAAEKARLKAAIAKAKLQAQHLAQHAVNHAARKMKKHAFLEDEGVFPHHVDVAEPFHERHAIFSHHVYKPLNFEEHETETDEF